MLKVLYKNNYLLRQLVKKDIQQRYQGSVLGMLWSFIVPILMLIIYTFVFSEVFQAKWNIDTSNKYEFALVLFCGLSAFNLVGEVMNRATVLIAMNTNYVKKVIFPLEILPVVVTISALFNCAISYIILIVAKLILYHNISSTLYLIFIALVPLVVMSVGLGLFISALSVYLKDVSNIISVLVTVLMYMSPVFFPLSSVPERFRFICEANPMTYIIENFRNVVLYGEYINWKFYGISCIVAFAIYLLGKVVFMRAKEGFADVL
ncbi:MAG: ABC transporter permease [Clostridiales bacterium]|nr:ABC transporter permease [Clostridiales bacterium]